MNWQFYLDDILIDEPVGFADIVLKVIRDPQWHGIFFEAATSDLQFYGDGAAYLMDKKLIDGFSAEVTFKAIVDCGEEDEIFSGKLDFRQYKESCGATCFVKIPVEQEGCIMTLRNRYDQKVDLSNQVAFDKLTILPDYAGLNFEMELAAQEESLIDEAQLTEDETIDLRNDPQWDCNNDGGITIQAYIMPGFDDQVNRSLGNFAPYSVTTLVGGGFTNGPPAGLTIPILTIPAEGVGLECDIDNAEVEFRLKGQINQTTSGSSTTQFVVRLFRLPNGADEMDIFAYETIYSEILATLANDDSESFDMTDTMPLPDINPGDQFYFAISLRNATGCPEVDALTYLHEQESYFKVTANGVCPPTDAKISLIHETASRIVEAITDRCLIVNSDYYGRTDSEPYAAAEDGCGSLRVLSNGLRIRQAETENHFLSLKEVFEGLNAIDNIGMGVEEGALYAPDVLRIEPVEYFYQDVEILRHPSIPKADFELQADNAYSIIKIGYKKWETENINGLDEFNSNKEFRTSLKSISNPLDQTSLFIAGGYPIEHTRQQSFADTGAADTKYDNETFIICVEREAYGYHVEQGNINSAANIYSPTTAYNWRIRPMYNLMRWWKSIAQSYTALVNSASKLFFSAGTGNLLAEGTLPPYDPCILESRVMAENDDLAKTDMVTGNDPIWKPETIKYRYPMSLKDYNIIKANPKGYIFAQCGSSDFVKGFIMNIDYRIAKGEADLTLKLKWGV